MTCAICCSNHQIVKNKKCKCHYCHKCMINWMKEELKHQDQLEQLRCPFEGCDQKFSLDKLQKIFKAQPFQTKFQDVLFENYLVKTQDIRPCPREGCSGHGFLPNKKCYEDFQCQNCNLKWQDPLMLPYLDKTFSFVYRFQQKAFTAIYQFILTNDCPNCGIAIYKTGGCRHMTCIKCNYQFCWNCKKPVQGHNEGICAINFFTFYCIILYGLLTILHSLGLLRFSLSCIYYILWALLYFFGYHLIVVTPALALISLIYSVKEAILYLKKPRTRYRNKLIPCSVCFLLSTVGHGILKLVLFTICEVTWIHVINFFIVEFSCFYVCAILFTLAYIFYKFIYLKYK